MSNLSETKKLEAEFSLLKSEIASRILEKDGYRLPKGRAEPRVSNNTSIDYIFEEKKQYYVKPRGQRTLKAAGRIVLFLIFVALSVVINITGISFVILDAIPMGVSLVFFSIIVLALLFTPKNRFIRATAIGTLIFIFILVPLTRKELRFGIHSAGEQTIAQGVHSLTYMQRLGLLWTLVWQSGANIITGSPHTGLSKLRMLTPQKEEVLIENNFPMKSTKIQSYIQKQKIKFRLNGGKEIVSEVDQFQLNRAGYALNWNDNLAEILFEVDQFTPKMKRTILDDFLKWNTPCEDDCDVQQVLDGGVLRLWFLGNVENCSAEVRVPVSFNRSKTDKLGYWGLQKLEWIYPHKTRYLWKC